jgi:hypothetical protein
MKIIVELMAQSISNDKSQLDQQPNITVECLTRECYIPAYWSLANCVQCEDIDLGNHPSYQWTYMVSGSALPNTSEYTNITQLKARLRQSGTIN